MCLAIPGQVIEIVDEANRLAKVDVAGVRRNVNVGLLDEDGAGRGTRRLGPDPRRLRPLQGRRGGGAGDAATARADGRRVRAGARGAEGERHRVTFCDAEHHCITCGDDGVPMRVLARRRRVGLAMCAGRRRRSRTPWTSSWSAPSAPGDNVLVHAGVALARLAEGPSREVRRRVPRRRARPRRGRRDPAPASSPAATTR